MGAPALLRIRARDPGALYRFDAITDRPRLRIVGGALPRHQVRLHKPEEVAAWLNVSDARFLRFIEALELGHAPAIAFHRELLETRGSFFLSSQRFGGGSLSPFSDIFTSGTGTATGPALVAHCDVTSIGGGGSGGIGAGGASGRGGSGAGVCKNTGVSVAAGDTLGYSVGPGGALKNGTTVVGGNAGSASTTSSGTGGFTGIVHVAGGGQGGTTATSGSTPGGTASGGASNFGGSASVSGGGGGGAGNAAASPTLSGANGGGSGSAAFSFVGGSPPGGGGCGGDNAGPDPSGKGGNGQSQFDWS